MFLFEEMLPGSIANINLLLLLVIVVLPVHQKGRFGFGFVVLVIFIVVIVIEIGKAKSGLVQMLPQFVIIEEGLEMSHNKKKLLIWKEKGE